jgi:hypothetical protein
MNRFDISDGASLCKARCTCEARLREAVLTLLTEISGSSVCLPESNAHQTASLSAENLASARSHKDQRFQGSDFVPLAPIVSITATYACRMMTD